MPDLKTENMGINLRQLMKELGCSQKEFSEQIGITEAGLSQLLNGERMPRIDTVLKIMKATSVKFERFPPFSIVDIVTLDFYNQKVLINEKVLITQKQFKEFKRLGSL